MANNNNKFNIKKVIIPIIVLIIAVICGLVFVGDWDAFLGAGADTGSSYSSDVSGSSDIETSTSQTTTAATTSATTSATSATTSATKATITTQKPAESSEPEEIKIEYYFRSEDQYIQHYEKHGHEFTPIFGEITLEEYLQYANALIASDADDILTKYEDDGDFMYFRKSTEEFLVLSPDGYIRTYFIPTDGIDYWNRQ